MLLALVLGSLIITINVGIQAIANTIWLKRIAPIFQKKEKLYPSKKILRLLSTSFLFFTFLHGLQTIIWAITYILIPDTNGAFANFTEAWYFSLATFTSLGFGDIVLIGDWRILSGIEAINGIMLIVWTTAMMYSLIQYIFKGLITKKINH
ncbi:Ion channel [Bizionia echini]|uniref:Ion channel n=1 Tax=Bizionia echini TaxID=649333 RepID=A0A1I4ZYJ0_9FLAO|nr:ion channel [Bizionia echini]SFN55180.1 Ion channel [Bizionia echini]